MKFPRLRPMPPTPVFLFFMLIVFLGQGVFPLDPGRSFTQKWPIELKKSPLIFFERLTALC